MRRRARGPGGADPEDPGGGAGCVLDVSSCGLSPEGREPDSRVRAGWRRPGPQRSRVPTPLPGTVASTRGGCSGPALEARAAPTGPLGALSVRGGGRVGMQTPVPKLEGAHAPPGWPVCLPAGHAASLRPAGPGPRLPTTSEGPAAPVALSLPSRKGRLEDQAEARRASALPAGQPGAPAPSIAPAAAACGCLLLPARPFLPRPWLGLVLQSHSSAPGHVLHQRGNDP